MTDVLIAAWNGKANAAHSHAQANITSTSGWITTALAGKASSSHTHTIANITNLQTTLDGKANAAHNHAQADIDSAAGWISTALAGKQPTGSYLTTTGQAFDSARLGGVVAGDFYHAGNSNKNTVNWTAKEIIANGSITSSGGESQYVVQAPTNRTFSKIKFSKFTGADCSAIHSFDESWESGNLNMSGGALNLAGRNGVTLGVWDNPVLVIDQRYNLVTV